MGSAGSRCRSIAARPAVSRSRAAANAGSATLLAVVGSRTQICLNIRTKSSLIVAVPLRSASLTEEKKTKKRYALTSRLPAELNRTKYLKLESNLAICRQFPHPLLRTIYLYVQQSRSSSNICRLS